MVGNIIQQSPQTENPAIVSYGAESLKNPIKELYLASNTVVNDLQGGGRFVVVRDGTRAAQLVNNLFLGAGEMLYGPGELRNNMRAAPSDFVDVLAFDYRLKRGSRAIGHGKEPGHARGFHLHPVAQYVHPMQKAPRRKGKNFDLGALEFTSR